MESTSGFEECLKLLKGERDEQRLAGLLLATKLIEKNDSGSILKVYDAVGVRFLNRLLKTGLGRGSAGLKQEEDREAYLRLAITVLAGFCRVQEIASSKDMVSRVPIILEMMSQRSRLVVYEECYEFLILVASASEDGLTTFYESGSMNMLRAQMPALPDGSPLFEHAMKLLQLILSKLPLDLVIIEYSSELASMVAAMARQFAVLHNALKFDVLHVLSLLLSSNYAAVLHDALRSMSGDPWATYIRVGTVAVLQSRVVSAEKLQALILAESMMTIVGESWLIVSTKLPDGQDPVPVDRCLFLVLESSRVEVAVLLNELAYLKFEASKSSSTYAEVIPLKQRNLAISFSLIEKIIKLISNLFGAEDKSISESTGIKVITGLSETVGLVLDYLQDAKEHGQKKGDDLLASVRIIGSYLAEAPSACKEKVQGLLEYILSVEGEDEPSPFYSVCFFLPMLCQRTMKTEGCRELMSFGGHRAVVDCLVRLIAQNSQMDDHNGTIFLACDTILNILLKREKLGAQLDECDFLHLLEALADWTEDSNDPAINMMASSICTLIFDFTSEGALLNYPNFKPSTINNLSKLITRSLGTYSLGEDNDRTKTKLDLHQIIASGYARWADRFPCIQRMVESRLLP